MADYRTHLSTNIGSIKSRTGEGGFSRPPLPELPINPTPNVISQPRPHFDGIHHVMAATVLRLIPVFLAQFKRPPVGNCLYPAAALHAFARVHTAKNIGQRFHAVIMAP